MNTRSALLMHSLWGGIMESRKSRLMNGVDRMHHPWETVQLSKSQRKGKSPEELEAMRKETWKAQVRHDADEAFESMDKEASE